MRSAVKEKAEKANKKGSLTANAEPRPDDSDAWTLLSSRV